MPKPIEVSFGRPRHGSMQATFRTDQSRLEIWASYIPHDSISELAGAIALVLKGGPQASVEWNEEPEEYSFQFLVLSDQLKLTVLRHPDSRRAKIMSREVLKVEGSLLEICLPFWRALCKLKAAMPLNEYKAAWGHRFPEAKLEEITTLIDAAKAMLKVSDAAKKA